MNPGPAPGGYSNDYHASFFKKIIDNPYDNQARLDLVNNGGGSTYKDVSWRVGANLLQAQIYAATTEMVCTGSPSENDRCLCPRCEAKRLYEGFPYKDRLDEYFGLPDYAVRERRAVRTGKGTQAVVMRLMLTLKCW